MKLTYYSQSSFMVDVQGKKILFDPFITDNELARDVNGSKKNRMGNQIEHKLIS